MPIWISEFLISLGKLSEFWSAIAGAVVGGTFSAILQLIATKAARTERQAQRNEFLKTLAHGVLWKTINIHSDLYNLHQHIEDAYRSVDEVLHRSPSQFVVQLASYPELTVFTAEEMSLVVSLGSDDVLNDMMVISKNHRTVIDAIKYYDQLRTELGAVLNLTSSEGLKGVVESEEELKKHAMKIAVLDDLIKRARTMCEQYEASAKETLSLLHKRLKEKKLVGGDLEFGFHTGSATMGRPS